MRNDRLSHVQSVSSANPSSYPNACSTHGVSQRHRDLLATRRYLKRSCIPHPASHSKMLRLLWSQHYYGLMLLVIVAAIVPSLSASPSRYSPFTADQDAVAAGRLSHFLWSGSPSRSPIPPPFLLSPFANNYYPSRLLMSPDRADFLNDDDDASFDNVPEEYSRSADGVEYLSWNGRLSHVTEEEEDDDDVRLESRGKFSNSRYRPFALSAVSSKKQPAGYYKSVPNGNGYNPSSSSPMIKQNWQFNNMIRNNMYQSCTDPSGLSGICSPGFLCSGLNGRPSGSCSGGFASVCCINVVSSCGGRVTVNNTYWQSPSAINSGTTCTLTVSLNPSLVEQTSAIAQVRLDFLTFAISQPNAETFCAVDSFNVAGAGNAVPSICGENPGQHMYLTVPSPVTDLQLSFIIGPSTLNRVWNIKISMLPTGASYLAPADCLQYFSSTSGTVISFNWKDVAGTTTRQLANQAYSICFRTELVSNQQATSLCLSPCTTTTSGLPYSISGAVAGSSQLAAQGSCNNDFLIFANGFDPTKGNPGGNPANNENDRFCGDVFAVQAAAAAPSIAVCSQVKPFRLYYQTNGDEDITATKDAAGVGNQGFCFNYLEKTT